MDSKGSLKKILGGGKPDPEPLPLADEESDALTIAEMDGQYASMLPANKNLTRIHVVLRDGSIQTFQNNHLDVRSTFNGKEFMLIFAGTKLWQVTVKGHGPDFWRLYDLCSLHRLPYLREATGSMPGVGGESETVLTEIKIADVTPRAEQ